MSELNRPKLLRAFVAVLTLVFTAAAGTLVSVPALAQEQAQAEQEQTLQTVVVTGSIIKRTDFETPSPVQVMTAEDLQQSGYTSVSDVLLQILCGHNLHHVCRSRCA